MTGRCARPGNARTEQYLLRHQVTRYIVQRLLLLPFLMLVYSFVIFVIMQAPPGDFLTTYVATLSASGTLDQRPNRSQALRHQYGLDQPFIVQYLYWLRDCCPAIWDCRWSISGRMRS